MTTLVLFSFCPQNFFCIVWLQYKSFERIQTRKTREISLKNWAWFLFSQFFVCSFRCKRRNIFLLNVEGTKKFSSSYFFLYCLRESKTHTNSNSSLCVSQMCANKSGGRKDGGEEGVEWVKWKFFSCICRFLFSFIVFKKLSVSLSILV